MNYARFLNRISAARTFSPIRKINEILAQSPPSMISLAGGNPNPDVFPFASAVINLKDGSSVTLDEKVMKVALQYGPTSGQPALRNWLKKMLDHFHNPPTLHREPAKGGLDLTITVGSQDAICKAFEMMVSEGDNILIDCPTYSGTLAVLRPLGVNMLSIDTDQHGLQPNLLRQVLSKWDPKDALDPSSDIPKVLYTIPNGVNPTGASLSLDRKMEIYKIAQEYDLMIFEDDPYYFLQFQDRQPSFLSMDVDGRVLRFDSFSKVLSSGLRLGVVSGPQPLVNRIQLHMMACVLSCPPFTQEVAYSLLDKWGIDGFTNHVKSVVDYYESQKNHMLAAANKHLKDLAEWNEPVAGMFLWMKLKGIADTKELIEQKAREKEVLLVPGCSFMPDDQAPSPYVRASFSLASPQQMDMGFERLAELIKGELQK